MKISASAPGKLVLIGEYAVLEGAPAIVMAADRRAEALIETNMLDHNAVETSNADGKKGFFVIGSDGQLDWQDTQHGLISKLRLFSDILEYMLLRLGFDQEKIPSFTAHLMTTDFFRQNGMAEKKLGLGSSAALTVAFASAFASYIGEGFRLEDKSRWLKELLAAHRMFQKGVGSGLDVAASLYGGVISYVMGRGDDAPRIKRLRLPDPLKLLCVWTGRAASTSQHLGKIRDWKQSKPEQYRMLMEQLGDTAELGADALENDDAESFIGEIKQYAEGLKSIDSAGNIGIYSAEHHQLDGLAESRNIVYKPCGAGGGDIGIVCSVDASELEEFANLVRSVGYRTVHLNVDPNGLEIRSIQE